MEKSIGEKCLDMGRDFAVKMLQQAVESANNRDQMNNQLHILNCAAIHILATNTYNRIKHNGEDEMTIVMDLKEQINDELFELFKHESEIEVIGIKNAEQ